MQSLAKGAKERGDSHQRSANDDDCYDEAHEWRYDDARHDWDNADHDSRHDRHDDPALHDENGKVHGRHEDHLLMRR